MWRRNGFTSGAELVEASVVALYAGDDIEAFRRADAPRSARFVAGEWMRSRRLSVAHDSPRGRS